MTKLETIAFRTLEMTKGFNRIEGEQLQKLVMAINEVYTAVVDYESGKDSDPCPLCGTRARKDGTIIVNPKLVRLK